jgi:hypothetical protein
MTKQKIVIKMKEKVALNEQIVSLLAQASKPVAYWQPVKTEPLGISKTPIKYWHLIIITIIFMLLGSYLTRLV